MNTTDICRVCMEDDCDVFRSLFELTPDMLITPSAMLVECAGTSVEKNDGLPEVVCSECLANLRAAYGFREKCRKSDRKLRKILNLVHKSPTESTDRSNSNDKEERAVITYGGGKEENPSLPNEMIVEECPIVNIKSEIISMTSDGNEEKTATNNEMALNSESESNHSSDDDNQFSNQENVIDPSPERLTSPVEFLKEEPTQDLPCSEPEYLIEGIKESYEYSELNNECSKSSHPMDLGLDSQEAETLPIESEGMDSSEELASESMEVEALEEIEYVDFEAIDQNVEIEETEDESQLQETVVCCGCPMEFSTQTELEAHSRKVHLPESDNDTTLQDWFVCDVCYRKHSSLTALNFHKKTRVSRKMRTCAGCHLVLNSVRKKKHHEQLHRLLPEDFTVICCGCDQVVLFKQLGSHAEQTHYSTALLNSEESAKTSNYVCEVCFLDCGFKQRLEMHQAKQVIPTMIQKKPISAPAEFAAPVAEFDGKRRFVCDVCRKTFSTKGNLKSHRILHITSARPFKCDQCDKTFTKKCNYNVHMLRIHSTENQFPCPECDKGFKCATNLKTHMRVHTKERPYRCDFCPKAFGYLSDKKRHEIGHSGNYPFKCGLCGKPFARKTLLNRHLETCMKRLNKHQAPQAHLLCFKGELKQKVIEEHAVMEGNELSRQVQACDQCEEMFSSIEELADHHANVHIQTLDEIEIE